MPAAYLNLSNPVKRETNTYVDQDGVQFSSMLVTATAASAPALLPAIGSAYEFNSALQVVQSDLSFSADGLGLISVTAAGPSSGSKPRYRIIPGGPKIYGLAPAAVLSGAPNYHPTSGVTVEVNLLAQEAEQQSIISTYSRKIMPASIGGLTLPAAASGPRDLSEQTSFGGSQVAGSLYSAVGAYLGFICVGIRIDQRGSALVVVLSFQEAGFYQTRDSGGNFISVFSVNM